MVLWCVAPGEVEGTIEVRGFPNGDTQRTFGAHPGSIDTLAVSTDGQVLATANKGDPDLRLWDLATGERVAQLRGHRMSTEEILNPIRVVFVDDRLISAGPDAEVIVWQLDPAKAKAHICRTLADTGAHDLAELGCPVS